MNKMNILNKTGLLTAQDGKALFKHQTANFLFETCLDLSEPVKITAFSRTEVSANMYSQNIAEFIAYWAYFVRKDLNGFSGFSNVKFEPIGFTIK